MKHFIIIIFLIISRQLAAQTLIEITATGNKENHSITLDKKISQSIKPTETYQVKINGVNSAHTSLKLKAKSKEIYTPLPDVLKTILPGLTGLPLTEGIVGANGDEIIAISKTKMDRLNLIKEKADSLHNETLFTPNTEKAKAYFKEIIGRYSNIQEKDLPDSVASDVSFLLALKDFADVLIKNETSFNPGVVKIYSDIVIVNNELKKNDYRSYFNYIADSKKAQTEIQSKTFSGSKDLIELNLILIDTYSKDTLANETRTLFTTGGVLGLSFSTGFFYTSGFSDQPYYLKSRLDDNVAVLPDKQIKSDISIGALAHVFLKASPFLRIGPSIGLSVSPFDGKSRYLLGISFLLGKEKMVGISTGPTWAKVKELSESVSTDSQGKYLPKGTTTIPTFDKIKNGWFFSLTYNLVSTRK